MISMSPCPKAQRKKISRCLFLPLPFLFLLPFLLSHLLPLPLFHPPFLFYFFREKTNRKSSKSVGFVHTVERQAAWRLEAIDHTISWCRLLLLMLAWLELDLYMGRPPTGTLLWTCQEKSAWCSRQITSGQSPVTFVSGSLLGLACHLPLWKWPQYPQMEAYLYAFRTKGHLLRSRHQKIK